MTAALLEVMDLAKRFPVKTPQGPGLLHAVNGVNFRIEAGESLSVVDPAPDAVASYMPAVLVYDDHGDGSSTFANAGTVQATTQETAGDITGLAIARSSGTGTGIFHNESGALFSVQSSGYIDPQYAWSFWARGYYAPQQAIERTQQFLTGTRHIHLDNQVS